jgi:hypothetical protein
MNISGKTDFLSKQPQVSLGNPGIYQPYHDKYDKSPKEARLNFSKDENTAIIKPIFRKHMKNKKPSKSPRNAKNISNCKIHQSKGKECESSRTRRRLSKSMVSQISSRRKSSKKEIIDSVKRVKDITEKCLNGILNSKTLSKSSNKDQRRKSTQPSRASLKPRKLANMINS